VYRALKVTAVRLCPSKVVADFTYQHLIHQNATASSAGRDGFRVSHSADRRLQSRRIPPTRAILIAEDRNPARYRTLRVQRHRNLRIEQVRNLAAPKFDISLGPSGTRFLLHMRIINPARH
jgi:hypothetical protein